MRKSNSLINIIAVEDDPHLLETLVEQISNEEGYEVTGVSLLVDAKVLIEQTDPNLVLLDVILPDGDGRDMCRWIRSRGYTMPILMLTAQDSELDAINGLEAGANDYISKPLRLGELLARIRMHLKQYDDREDARISIGAFSFSPGRKTLIHRGTAAAVTLTEKEAAIIKYLQRNHGDVVNKPDLLKQIWGYNAAVTTHTLETHIYRLRQKINYIDDSPFLITKENGYTLV